MSLNKVILMGNLTADPELKQTASGVSVTSFAVAVNRRFAREGEPSVDYINCVAWRTSADFVCKYFKKGSSIVLCGQIQTRSYTDRQEQKRYVTEVVCDEVSFGAPKPENSAYSASTPSTPANTPPSYTPSFSGDARLTILIWRTTAVRFFAFGIGGTRIFCRETSSR